MQENNDKNRRWGTLLVTGAPGWLADALFASVAKDPPAGLQRVRCLVHHSVPATALREWRKSLGVDVEIVHGDLSDRDSLHRAVQGVTSILHAAAIIHVERIRDYYEVNTEGTRKLAEEAAAAGVERMVLVSSNAAGGKGTRAGRLIEESDPPRPLTHYGRSKFLSERAMFAVESPMERVVLRPCMFYGPPVPQRHVEVFRRVLHGRMPLVGDGSFSRSLTHIDHIVSASRLALSHRAAVGNTYYVADAEPYTLRSVIEAMAYGLGVEPRWLPVPSFASTIAHEVDTVVSRFDRYWQTTHLVGEANWHVGVSIERARRDLGFAPTRSAKEGMRGAVEWCRERGLI